MLIWGFALFGEDVKRDADKPEYVGDFERLEEGKVKKTRPDPAALKPTVDRKLTYKCDGVVAPWQLRRIGQEFSRN